MTKRYYGQSESVILSEAVQMIKMKTGVILSEAKNLL